MKISSKILIGLIILPFIHMNCTKPYPPATFKPIIEKYVEYWNTGNFDNIEKVLHPDFELRMTPKFEAEIGISVFKKSVLKWREAYPDFHIELHEIIYDKDSAAARWTITATNTGHGWHPPTGKNVKVMGISILHFVDNKIKDEWIASNNLDWLQQLGYTFSPPSEKE